MDFKHISLESIAKNISYKGTGRGNFKRVDRDIAGRKAHGEYLSQRLQEIMPSPTQTPDGYISEEEPGVYLEISSEPGFSLTIESLDTRDCRLCNVHDLEDGSQKVTVFVFDNRRKVFLNKLSRYTRQEGGRTHDPLFDNVKDIRLAELRDFWTSSPQSYPGGGAEIWWEVWLSRRSQDRREIEEFKQYCNGLNLECSNGVLEFELYSVLAVKATGEKLSESITLISCLSELRGIVDTAAFLLQQSPSDQADWADHLLAKTVFEPDGATSILIVDQGVNYTHPLLEHVVSEESCFAWDKTWPQFDAQNDHGTMQAGISVYGDIAEAILDDESIKVTYLLESSRILAPAGSNDKELYGSLTYFSVSEAERIAGDVNRIVSLAVTAAHDGETGQPTSWSSEIDQLMYKGRHKRLFMISAGNIRGEDISSDYVTNVLGFPIEDPAQAWNALTVGAYTNKVDISDHSFKGWVALSDIGDISPTSRTSQNWNWRSEAPMKPDVVEEGGNLLLSPDGESVSNADCVSLVTTADHSSGHLFRDHGETSAANALVSRIGARLWSVYPEYWSETIRALIVHSASWTEKMRSYQVAAEQDGSPPREAKELLLRMFGHGVPSFNRAEKSTSQYLNLVIQDHIKPYKLKDGDLSFDEMHLVELPWPQDELLALGNADVRLRITLSYYVEPNPGRRSYTLRYRYQSFGLRFKLINGNEDTEDFIKRLNVAERDDNYSGGQADRTGWELGDHLRTRGTIHQDTWEGSAAELALRNSIAIVPVAGWWKQRQKNLSNPRDEVSVPYSLVVSLDAFDADIDIYSPVATEVGIDISVPLEI